MSMSYESTEGPYGLYPNENGYLESLEKYKYDQFEKQLNKKRYNDDKYSWEQIIYTYIKYNPKNLDFSNNWFLVLQENKTIKTQFINYLLFKIEGSCKIELNNNTNIDNYINGNFNIKQKRLYILDITDNISEIIIEKILQLLQQNKNEIIVFTSFIPKSKKFTIYE